jgi:hypothetical protein
MKKIAALFALLASLVLAGLASAFVGGQGYLTGGAVGINGAPPSVNVTSLDVVSTIHDGELVNVAKKNDKSGDCDGDIGSVGVDHDDSQQTTETIVCAHYTGGAGMAFDWHDSVWNRYVVVYIVDRSNVEQPDRIFIGGTNGDTAADAKLAMKWVNLGWIGSGAKGAPNNLPFPEVTFDGDYRVQASAP